MRKAKILATLGPASREPATLEALLAAGANAVRINMSHGSQEEHAETLRRAREASTGGRGMVVRGAALPRGVAFCELAFAPGV